MEEKKWHCVSPKKNCPHVHDVTVEIPKGIKEKRCEECGEEEIWMCLTCGVLLCSRYKNKHMAQHVKNNRDHPIAVSFSDLSFWCFKCSSYITTPRLKPTFVALYNDKFGASPGSSFGKDRDVKEYFDKPEDVKKKVLTVAKWLKESKHCVIFTGAGVSTASGIPDYRGPKGCWTMRDQGKRATFKVKLADAQPTLCHRLITDLTKRGAVKHVISTNIDGLHSKSGQPLETLSELHGNVFKERCVDCEKIYYRDFSTTERSRDQKRNNHKKKKKRKRKKQHGGHYHGRECEECGGDLVDTIINFKENLDPRELGKALTESEKSDLSLVLGTSMSVQPACSLPLYAKKNDGKVILVNLQRTPYEDMLDCNVFCKTDEFLKMLVEEFEKKEENE